MIEFCPRCGKQMVLIDLRYIAVLPTGESINKFWGCNTCHSSNSVRGWAFAISEGEIFVYLDKDWQKFDEPLSPNFRLRVVFT